MDIPCAANPTGGVVVLGDAQIQSTFPGLTTIHQQSNNAVINWSTFNISSGEHTNFIVPSATAATLNRVLDGGPSLLDGTLTSNGQVFLINASGIIFGKGSMVDVAGLTASTLDLSNRMFMAGGQMAYQGNTTAGVTNAGTIRASSGDVFLIGFQVNNSGVIRAPNGTVGLAAGTDVLIMPAGDERVIIRNAAGPQRSTGVSNSGLIKANVAELKAYGGNVYALAIQNSGRIAATAATRQGGRIILSANGGNIQSTGKLAARGLSGNGGQIKINAGSQGRVTLGGRVAADGTTGSGGSINVNGGEVTVRRAILVTADGQTAGGQIDINATPQGSNAPATTTIIDGTIRAEGTSGTGGIIHLGGTSLALGGTALISANGAAGGGSIFAGGGAQGLDPGMANSTQVEIQSGAVLAANAGATGNGGTVVAFASNQLTFNGTLQARGGQTGGDGGQAELSGKQALILESLTGKIDLSAPQGRSGSLLLDPNDILISDCVVGNTITNPVQANTLRASDISCWLETNCGNLIIQTNSSAAGGSGNITLAGLIHWNSSTSLTINADRDFIMNTQSGGTGVIQSNGSGDVIINAGRSVQIQAGSQILTHSGNVTINANQGATSFEGDFQAIIIGGQIISDSGNITLAGRTGTTSSAQTAAILLDNGSGVSTGNFGVVTLQTAGGSVLGHGSITSWGLKLAGAGDFYLTNAGNAVQTLTSVGTIGSIQILNTLGLTIGTIGADSGLSAFGGISITTTNSDHIRINQNLSSQGGVITLTGYGIEVNGSSVSNTGAGSIYLTAQRDINVNSGASISVVDGRMELDANQYPTPIGGNSTGILLNNATLTTSGMGAIALNGRSGDTGDNNVGILMQHGATIHSTSTAPTAGYITLLGVGGGGNGSGNRGVSLQDAGTAITSAGATVAITGSGTPVGLQNAGVNMDAGTAIINSSATIIHTDTIAIAGAATIGGGGTLEIRTVSAGTTIGLGDGASGTLMINSAGIGALSSLSHITIGAATTADIDIRATSWHAPLTILTLGEIAVSGQIMDLGGPVTLNSSNTILCAGIATAGGEIILGSPVTLAANAVLDTTNGGALPNGASITVSGAITDPHAGGSIGHDLTLNAGLAGSVTLQGAVGQSATPLHAVNLTGGTLMGAPQIYSQWFSATFNGVMDFSHLNAATVAITGGAGDDTIILTQVPGSLAVNGAAGNDTVSFAAATGPVSVSAASFTSIENLIGSASYANTLIGLNGGNVFQITAHNAGTLGTLHFSSFQNLTGSSNGTNQFVFSNQATLDGMVNGSGNPLAVLILDDSNLQVGQTYTIGASQISVGSRTYAFQGVNTVGLNLGAGNDTTSTSFYTFSQNFNGGGGNDQLVVDGTKVVTTPLTKPGFGTITTTGFATSPPVITPVTNVYLQNFNPSFGTSSSSASQTNNFNSTTTSGGIGGIGPQGGAGAAAGGAGLAGATSATSFLGQTFGTGSGSIGGGGPASLAMQSLMNSSTSAAAERELNMSLGGDGTVRLQNAGGLLSIGAGANAPSTTSQSQMDSSMSLLAQSELSIGAIGRAEVPLTVQAGAQSIALGAPVPSLIVQQFLTNLSNPQTFSLLSLALGGNGTARLDFSSGSILMDLNGKVVPPRIERSLLANISAGTFGELALVLGGLGEYLVTERTGVAVMDPMGAAAPPEVLTQLHSLLAPPGAAGLSLAQGGDATALVLPWDGMVNTALNGVPPGPFVILKLQNATDQQSQEELDRATR